MGKFDAAIRTLKSTLGDVDEYGVVGQEADETRTAIRVLEAAEKVDKEIAWQELADSDVVCGLDGGLYDLISAIPEEDK